MEKILLAGLTVAIAMVAWVWSGSVPEVTAQDECSNIYAEPPFSPNTPGKLVAFRKVMEDGPQPKEEITLHWINETDDANCFVVQVNFVDGPGASAEGGWVILETINDPRADQYQHRDVPSSGEACYRVYAANRTARSDHSNRVCLELGTLTSKGTVTGLSPASDGGTPPKEGPGLEAWHIIIIVLAAAAVAVGTGAAVWRYRTRRSRSGIS